MYQKIKAKFKASPTIFYACSIVASWAGVGSLMNFRTIALRYGAVPAIIWAVFNSLACITFGLFADRVPSIRRIMQSKVMFYFIGLLTLFQTWTQMSGIYEIFGDTPVGTKGGMIIVYVTCVAFLIMLLKDGMIRNVLSDGFSWVVVYGLLAVVVAAALVYTGGTFAVIDPGVNAAGIKAGVYNGLLLLPGPFACPYYYSLFEYNDKNADGTKRGELEEESEKKDYKALCKDLLFLHPEKYTIAKDTKSHLDHWRGLFIKTYGIAEQKHYKTMYEGLLYGDPKMRILRILWTTIYNDHNARIKEEQNHGKH